MPRSNTQFQNRTLDLFDSQRRADLQFRTMTPITVCGSCGAQCASSDQFCPECGVLIDKTAGTSAKTQPCPDCGRLISPHAEACPGCGRFIQNLRNVVITVDRRGWAGTIAWGIILAYIISVFTSVTLFVLFWFLIFASIVGSMNQPINR